MGRSEEEGCSPPMGAGSWMLCQSPSPASKGPIYSVEQIEWKWCFLSAMGAAGLGFLMALALTPPSTLSAAEVPGAPLQGPWKAFVLGGWGFGAHKEKSTTDLQAFKHISITVCNDSQAAAFIKLELRLRAPISSIFKLKKKKKKELNHSSYPQTRSTGRA